MSSISLPLCIHVVLEDILADIEGAMRDLAGQVPVSLDALRGALARKVLEDSGRLRPPMGKSRAVDETPLLEAFTTYYFEQTRKHVEMFDAPVRPLRGEELSVLGMLRFAERVQVPAEGAPLERAIEQARWNMQQAASAQSALFVLAGLARSAARTEDARSRVEETFEKAREVLFARMQQFEATHTRLVLISGEPVRLQQLRERLATEHYGPGKVVDHLLNRGEQLPGISYGAATEALRADIARAAKTPLGVR